jgi:hypothetical protein
MQDALNNTVINPPDLAALTAGRLEMAVICALAPRLPEHEKSDGYSKVGNEPESCGILAVLAACYLR